SRTSVWPGAPGVNAAFGVRLAFVLLGPYRVRSYAWTTRTRIRTRARTISSGRVERAETSRAAASGRTRNRAPSRAPAAARSGISRGRARVRAIGPAAASRAATRAATGKFARQTRSGFDRLSRARGPTRDGAPGDPRTRPGPLEVEAADPAVDIEHFAHQEQSPAHARLHG